MKRYEVTAEGYLFRSGNIPWDSRGQGQFWRWCWMARLDYRGMRIFDTRHPEWAWNIYDHKEQRWLKPTLWKSS